MARRPPRVLLATSSEHATLTASDRLLRDALGGAGVRAEPAIWDDPGVNWAAADLVVIRSTWDYHTKLDAFLGWVNAVAVATALENDARLVRWNAHKGYLRDLERAGAPVVETEWVAAGADCDLAALLRERGWPAAFVKPAVGAGALGGRKVALDGGDAGAQQHLDAILARGDALVQPYVAALERTGPGEVNIVFIAGEPAHAVMRWSRLATGTADERVEARMTPTREEERLARAALDVARARSGNGAFPLYARVDMVRDEERGPRVLELEAIEPNLWLEEGPATATRLAREIAARVA